jgi:hypothetical protein
MGECPSDLPTVATIEFDRSSIRLNYAEMQYFKAPSDDFSLSLRQQSLAYPISAPFAKHP